MEASTATLGAVQTRIAGGEDLALPVPPTPVPELVEALRKVAALQELTDADLEWLARHCEEFAFPSGAPLFREGDPATKMTILLRGEVHVRRSQSGVALFLGRSGPLTGLLPFSRMKTHGGQG
ncbi:MAG: cyclic nucleotide-binding domain-containing protein, partial [Acidobacteriaceae bacterium]